MKREWFYWSDGVDDWRGENEMLRLSTIIWKQRSVIIHDRRYFHGQTFLELEVVWRFYNYAAAWDARLVPT